MPATETFKPANLDSKTVKRILNSALACWSKEGYHGASLREIAEHAGVAKSLLHYHFSSKEHLLVELLGVYFHSVSTTIRARLAMRKPSIENALDMMDQVLDIIIESRATFPFALEIWRASIQNKDVRQRVNKFERDILELFKEGVVTSLGPLTARLSMPPERFAEVLQVAFGGLQLQLFLHPDPKRLKQVFADFKTLVQWGALLPERGEQS